MKKTLLVMLLALLAIPMAMRAEDSSAPVFTFDFVNKTYGMTRYTTETAKKDTDYNPSPLTINSDDESQLFSFTVVNGDGGKNRLWSNTGLRLFGTSKSPKTYALTIAGQDGVIINKIEFAKENGSVTLSGDGVVSNTEAATWTGSAQSVSLTATAKANKSISTIKIYYTIELKAPSTPVVTFANTTAENNGIYEVAPGMEVSVACSGATKITVENKSTKESKEFDGNKCTFTVTEDAEYDIYGENEVDFSDIVNVSFMIPELTAPVVTPGSGTIDTATEITMTSDINGATIKYYLDENIDEEITYTGPFTISQVGVHTIDAWTVYEGYEDLGVKSAETVTYTIQASSAPESGDFTFDFVNKDYGMTRYTTASNDYNPSPLTINSDDESQLFSFTVVNGEGGKNRLWSSTGLRLFGKTDSPKTYDFTIAGQEGVIINKIEFAKESGAITLSGEGVVSESTTATWTGFAQSVSLTAKATDNKSISTIKIYYTIAADIKLPAVPTYALAKDYTVTFTAEEGCLVEYWGEVVPNPDNQEEVLSFAPRAATWMQSESNTVDVVAPSTMSADEVYQIHFRALQLSTYYYSNESFIYVESHGGLSGVNDIVTDQADAVYYNLQGVRVDNPAAGLYIRRQGNTATKVYIR